MKEDTFNKYWDALENAQPIEIDPRFLERLEASAIQTMDSKIYFSRRTLMGIAASLLLLISVNAYVLTENSQSMASDLEKTESPDYRLIPNPLI